MPVRYSARECRFFLLLDRVKLFRRLAGAISVPIPIRSRDPDNLDAAREDQSKISPILGEYSRSR